MWANNTNMRSQLLSHKPRPTTLRMTRTNRPTPADQVDVAAAEPVVDASNDEKLGTSEDKMDNER